MAFDKNTWFSSYKNYIFLAVLLLCRYGIILYELVLSLNGTILFPYNYILGEDFSAIEIIVNLLIDLLFYSFLFVGYFINIKYRFITAVHKILSASLLSLYLVPYLFIRCLYYGA